MSTEAKHNIKVEDMDISTPIQLKEAIKGLGGEPSIFYMMLGNLEPMTMNATIKGMIPAFDNKDYAQMKGLAHNLKGSAAYVGASRLHYACYFIQEHYVYQNFPKMLDYYPELIEAAIEFKVHSRQLIAKSKNQTYKLE